MIGGRRVLGIVTARGGSKSFPDKNTGSLAGRPILQWTADAAAGSRYIDRTILSTDDPVIAELGADAGLEMPFWRPSELAADTTPSADVALHALSEVGAEEDELFVLLQPTSPLRITSDIDGAIELLVESDADTCVSVHLARERLDLMVFVDAAHQVESVIGSWRARRRQDALTCHILNGAVYVARVGAYQREPTFIGERTVAFVMPEERGLDVDDRDDLALAEARLRERLGRSVER